MGVLKWSIHRIVCPHHACWDCGKKAPQAGGLLFPCVRCVKAYCEECLDWPGTSFVGENHIYEYLGYFSHSAFFIECMSCSRAAPKRYLQRERVGGVKRCRVLSDGLDDV